MRFPEGFHNWFPSCQGLKMGVDYFPLIRGDVKVALNKVGTAEQGAKGLYLYCQGGAWKGVVECGLLVGVAGSAKRLTRDLHLHLRGEGGECSAQLVKIGVLCSGENCVECGPRVEDTVEIGSK